MFIVYDENMNEKGFPKGVTPLDIQISSIEKERVTSKLEGSNRKIDYGYSFNDREINLRMMLRHRDASDYFLLKDEIYSMFQLNDRIFISESHQKGKRYLVSVDERYEPTDINRTSAIVEISCTTVDLPFAESIGTTADIDKIDLLSNQSFTQGYWVNIIGGNNTAILSTTVRTINKIDSRGNVEYEAINRSNEADLIISMYNSSGYKKRNVISPNEGNDYAERHTFTTDDDIVLIGVHFSTVSTTGSNISPSDVGDSLKATLRKSSGGGISSEDELWGFGMGLIADDDSLIYTHNSTSFKVFNAGNVEVHPFEQEVIITISDVVGSTDYFQLENQTTGDVFRVNEQVTDNQLIKLDGPNITSNDLQYLRKTNKQYITLAPGWNNFRITGADSAKVSFGFRFYYL